jgi:cob(I)alamin adenosyltransferase
MKIYTKSGDTGETGLYGGGRVSKGSLRIQLVGELDELNASIGLARTYSAGHALDAELDYLQNILFDVGAEIACSRDGKFELTSVRAEDAIQLEHSMDSMSETLPELKTFILPGGCPLAAHLHVSRSVCRRVERSLVTLNQSESVRHEVMVFLNRLSDWLFMAARTANHSQNVNDIAWKQLGK